MTALTDLLAKVEAGAYEREGGPKRYTAFWDDCKSAGVPKRMMPELLSALENGFSAHILRALIAREEA